ncbi:MAG TPA: trehalase-like domain-containing protein, partial [Acidimicrobiales bacterium]|nr:trehalase-like domain-containing protein [Acidimicrobiales bacterium]
MSEYPPIADYAFLSDCEATCLIAPDSAVEWLCLPRPDSPSVFGSLLDRSAGSFRFAPDHVHAPSHRRYLPGSMVLETTWHTHTGWMVIRDALVMAPWTGGSRSAGRQRPPSDFTARGALVRTATCIEGQVDVFVDCLPLFDYGRSVGTWEYAGDGYNVATCAQGKDGLTLRLGGTLPLGLTGARASSRVELRKGQTGFICLSWG